MCREGMRSEPQLAILRNLLTEENRGDSRWASAVRLRPQQSPDSCRITNRQTRAVFSAASTFAGREGHAAQADSGRIEDRVGDRRQRRLEHRLARAVVRQVRRASGSDRRSREMISIDSGVSRCVSVGARRPVHARHLLGVEPHFLVQRAAQRVQQSASRPRGAAPPG